VLRQIASLDHVIVLSEAHLRWILRSYAVLRRCNVDRACRHGELNAQAERGNFFSFPSRTNIEIWRHRFGRSLTRKSPIGTLLRWFGFDVRKAASA
jgi:hypothetical protein